MESLSFQEKMGAALRIREGSAPELPNLAALPGGIERRSRMGRLIAPFIRI